MAHLLMMAMTVWFWVSTYQRIGLQKLSQVKEEFIYNVEFPLFAN
jgi:hypothetical protein